ncbi:MAG: hypothetical protein LUM44_04390 [Pyrinomonadaceae bacterium]|nr:hypothetical protein [Pyrinomonadaceae bacterium]
MKKEFFSMKTAARKKVSVPGKRQSIFSRIFGCAHTRMSKPVTIGETSFQYCSECGARRQYDIEKFKPFGAFYRPEIGKNLYYI